MAARTQANGNSRRLSACQRRAAVERTWHRAPGSAAAVWHLRGSGADGQSALSDWDVSHGRTRREIHWARRRRAQCARGAPGGSPCGAERARCRAAAFGIARQSDADRAARRVDGHGGRCPRASESCRRRFGVAAGRLRKGQEPNPPSVRGRKPSAWHSGRAGIDLRGVELMFASLNQNWLSAKYHRTTNLTVCDRAVSSVIQTAEWSNELVWRCALISRLAPGPVP